MNGGKDVIIDFKPGKISNPAIVDRSKMKGPGIPGDLVSAKEVALDDFGMSQAYQESIYGIRGYVQRNLKEGIDVINPDPSDPEAMKRHALFNKAMSVHKDSEARLVQARQNQEMMMEAFVNGKIVSDKGALNVSPQNMLTPDDVVNMSMPTDSKYVKEINRVMNSTKPRTKEEADALYEYREKALAEIDRMVGSASISPMAAEYYKSQIAPAPTFDTGIRDAKIKSEVALANQRNASAQASRAKAKADAEGGSGSSSSSPYLFRTMVTHTREAIQNQKSGEFGPASHVVDLSPFSGLYLNGNSKEGFVANQMLVNQEGDIVLSFSKDGSSPLEDTETREATFKGNDIVGAYLSMLPPAQRRGEEKQLSEAGIPTSSQYDIDQLERILTNQEESFAPSSTLDAQGDSAPTGGGDQGNVNQSQNPLLTAPGLSILVPEEARAALQDPSNTALALKDFAINELGYSDSSEDMAKLRTFMTDYFTKLSGYATAKNTESD